MAAPDHMHHGEPLARAQAVCVLVHGRGQTPEEMIGQVVAQVAVPGVAWVLPRAEGKSWYKARAIDPLTDETRAQVAAALDVVSEAVAVGQGKPVVLAGFSQGACVSLEWAFAHGPKVAACVALTGCRVGVAGDARPLSALAGLPVYLTGSDNDPWIPVAAFAEAAADLGRAQARLRAELFPGRPHTSTVAECAALADILSRLIAGRPAMEAT